MMKTSIFFCLLLLPVANAESFPANGATDTITRGDPTHNLHLTFPRDHGAHPPWPTEWWYFMGELTSETGDTDGRWGYQIVFFRRQVSPDSVGRGFLQQGWKPPTLFPAHYALTDLRRETHSFTQEISRPLGGLAGADTTGLHVWSRYGEVSMKGNEVFLRAAPPSPTRESLPEFELTLSIDTPPVLHGESGWAPSGLDPGEGSYYYSWPHLSTRGQLVFPDKAGGDTLEVRGRSWMDHQFMDESGPTEVSGWDWFGIMFEDGSSLMVYFVRGDREDRAAYGTGTWVGPERDPSALDPDDLLLIPTDRWQSPRTGFTYPAGWRLKLPRLEMDLSIAILVPDCELDTRLSTGTVYWEGPLEVTGLRAGQEVTGFGYAELVGYDR